MIIRSLCLLLFSVTCLSSFSQSADIVWAKTVVKCTSQKSDKLFASSQALGAPNRYPNPSYTTCAWSPEVSDSRDSEEIHVKFDTAVIAKQILIAESANAGHIRSIWVYAPDGSQRKAFERTTPSGDMPGRMFVVNLKGNTKQVNAIRLVMDKPTLYNTYQIDAIGLSAAENAILPTLRLAETPFPGKAERLPDGINSAYDEVYPLVAPDGKTLYFDRKLDPANIGEQHADDIWISTNTGTSWSTAINLGPPLNNKNHNFMCAISPDGNTAVVGNTYGAEVTNTGISITKRSSDTWTIPEPIVITGFENLNQYNEFSMSASGNILLMSIEKADGMGLLDLYVSFRQADGSFGVPKPLGVDINTAGSEMTPFLAADESTLYFSSNGFPGYGNQDIFVAKRLDDSWQRWTSPVNLGPEVNTPEWDVYFSIDADGDYGYFSSSKNAITNLDIYRIQLPPELQPDNILWLKGNISDRITGQPLKAMINYESTGVRTGTGTSGEDGNYALVMPGATDYHVLVSAKGYLTADTIIDLKSLLADKQAIQDFELVAMQEGIVIKIPNILFKVNSAVLEDTSFIELERIARLLINNPGISVEIRGHTNGMCDDTYCKSLSTKRAESVVKYLVSKGISPERLTSKGYGKSMPVADNTTPEGRQANQRVEFMITKVGD
ncbi:MAG TPA: OmpA family protein [Chitinophagales bacterium]|nr:OmpA family protein [Chitinophagales bacterium]HNE46225.1 OmpA family protein [Chitinophagales bacterium]HNJ88459.1 OmpA family protein [Chitinophagales bacterium]HNK98105.1 OmpA family protein [Chitinophagales bacterium]HNM07497.1 OmpA family protein [Chitinophagales bacterium]